MPYPGKGRATGYSDYFKDRQRTPDNEDDDEEGKGPMAGKQPLLKKTEQDDARKSAIKRRLMKMRKK